VTLRPRCVIAAFAMTVLVAATGAAAAKDAAKSDQLVAKVVAVDLQAKSIRIDDGTAESQTYFVVGEAAERLDELPVGRMFTLTFRDSDDGKRRDVIAIKLAKGTPKN